VAEHGERVGDAAGAEDGEDAFAVGEGVGAVGPTNSFGVLQAVRGWRGRRYPGSFERVASADG
jgi:hypothetical protein